jgi:hypothetical protein
MKTRNKTILEIILYAVVIPVLIIAGIIGGIVLNNYETKNSQIEFLKAHETEITNEIKRQDNRVARVTYNWNSVKRVDSGPFTKEAYDVDVDVYNSKNVNFNGGWVSISVDNMSHPTRVTDVAIPHF